MSRSWRFIAKNSTKINSISTDKSDLSEFYQNIQKKMFNQDQERNLSAKSFALSSMHQSHSRHLCRGNAAKSSATCLQATKCKDGNNTIDVLKYECSENTWSNLP